MRRSGRHARGGGNVRVVSLPFPTLGALPATLSSALQLPTAPTTTSTHTPTTLAALNTALAIDGAHVTVTSLVETTGTITVDANDVVLIAPNLSGLQLEIAQAAQRVSIQGGTFRNISFRLPAYYDNELEMQVVDEALHATDVRFTGVTVPAFDTVGVSASIVYGKRIYFDGCTLRGSDYGMFVGQAGSVYNQDIVVRNCIVAGKNEASLRLLRTTRHVCVGSTLGAVGSNKHGWRIHQQTSLAYCARNDLSPGGIMLSDPAEPSDTGLGEFWFEDNDVVYTLANGIIITSSPYTRFTQGTIKDNRFTMTGASVFADIWSYGAVPGNWTLTGNTILAP